MSSPQPPGRRRPPPASPQASSPTTIHDLGDDLLLRIFLHLPSLPTLVRAAMTCRAFLAAVRSSPAFRRRFRALHAPPLLGLFLDPNVAYVGAYAPLRRRSEPDFNAAVRASDIFISGFPDEIISDISISAVCVADCGGGYVLLLNSHSRRMAAYNPLTRALDLVPAAPDEIVVRRDRKFVYLRYHMLACDESPGLFRVLCISIRRDESLLRAAVFSSGTREWQILPWTGGVPTRPWSKQHCTAALVKGSMYWSHVKEDYSLVLNTDTLQFSWMDLPDQLKGEGPHNYRIGQSKDGNLCIVSVIEFTLSVWLRRADADRVEKWVLDSVIQLKEEVLLVVEGEQEDVGVLEVWAILDGMVHLLMKSIGDGTCWFLSFCLETRELKKMFQKAFGNFVNPYIMAWPPSLEASLIHTLPSHFLSVKLCLNVTM